MCLCLVIITEVGDTLFADTSSCTMFVFCVLFFMYVTVIIYKYILLKHYFLVIKDGIEFLFHELSCLKL